MRTIKMANENFELFDPKLKRRRSTGASRRSSLQPIAYRGGIPSAENARQSGLTSAALANLVAPQDFSGTGATGSADKAIQNSRRIKRDRQVTQLLSTLGGQQLQDEGATARSEASNRTSLQVAGLTNQAASDRANSTQEGSLAKQGLIGEQKASEQASAQQAVLDQLRVKAEIGEGVQERSTASDIAAAELQDERSRSAENRARAFDLFKGGDSEGAERLSRANAFNPSYGGLTPPGSPSDFKFIPGQKSSVKGIETVLPGKVFNTGTGDVQTDISDLSPEERDALLKILENRETQGLN
jgi:hypothetical protein